MWKVRMVRSLADRTFQPRHLQRHRREARAGRHLPHRRGAPRWRRPARVGGRAACPVDADDVAAAVDGDDQPRVLVHMAAVSLNVTLPNLLLSRRAAS